MRRMRRSALFGFKCDDGQGKALTFVGAIAEFRMDIVPSTWRLDQRDAAACAYQREATFRRDRGCFFDDGLLFDVRFHQPSFWVLAFARFRSIARLKFQSFKQCPEWSQLARSSSCGTPGTQ